MHLRHTQNVFEMLYTIGANSKYMGYPPCNIIYSFLCYMLLKFPRLRKVSAEFRRKIRHKAKFTRRARLEQHARRVFSAVSYFFGEVRVLWLPCGYQYELPEEGRQTMDVYGSMWGEVPARLHTGQ